VARKEYEEARLLPVGTAQEPRLTTKRGLAYRHKRRVGPDCALSIDGEEPHMTMKPDTPQREGEMTEFSVGFDGFRYHYNGYRYDRWEDAVAYARLLRNRPSQIDAAVALAPGRERVPSDTDQALMASLGIRFDGRAYRFGDYRYDQLSDAVTYARRAQSQHGDPP